MNRVTALVLRSLSRSLLRPSLGKARRMASDRNKPGEFDYYALVLGWAPTYCQSEGNLRKEGECDGACRMLSLLHGLWPQYEKRLARGLPTRNAPLGA